MDSLNPPVGWVTSDFTVPSNISRNGFNIASVKIENMDETRLEEILKTTFFQYGLI
jgi:hypothetical protein